MEFSNPLVHDRCRAHNDSRTQSSKSIKNKQILFSCYAYISINGGRDKILLAPPCRNLCTFVITINTASYI